MKPLKKLMAVALAMTLLTTGCSSNDEYVATLGDKKISSTIYKYFLSLNRENVEAQMQVDVTNTTARNEFWAQTAGDKTYEETVKEMAMNMCKEYVVLFDKAKAENIEPNQDILNSINDQSKQYYEMGGKTTVEKNRAFQDTYGIPYKDMGDLAKDLATVQTFSDKTFMDVTNTDDELKSHYEENKDSMFDLVTVKHILFKTVDDSNNPVSEEDKAKVLADAESIKQRILDGEDMVELAKEFSQDPGSKDTGGEYTFGRGQMVAPFEEWSFNAKEGDVDIVETDFGYHVMRFEKHSTYDDVKDSVEENLTQKKFVEQIQSWVDEQASNFVINESVYKKIKLY